MTETKKKFTVRITYFKPSGKLYTSCEEDMEVRANGDAGCNMNDVVAKIRGLRDGDGQGALPGLSSQSHGWDGFILVDCDEGHPCLIVPREERARA